MGIDEDLAKLLLAGVILDLQESLYEEESPGYEPPANVEINRCKLREIVANLLKVRDLFGKDYF